MNSDHSVFSAAGLPPWVGRSVTHVTDLEEAESYSENVHSIWPDKKDSGGMRCTVRRLVLPLITFALLTVNTTAQDAQSNADRSKTGPLTQITIEGRQITGDNMLVRKGTTYISLPALARALGASVVSQGQVAVLSIPTAPESACEGIPEAKRLSDAYRKAAVRIPDAIESLRVQVSKPGAVIPEANFAGIEHDISEAEFRAKTEADKSVSYALSHANNLLAIMYYRLLRGVPTEYAQQGQLDLVLCTMESKYALQVGHFSGKEVCTVFVSASKEAGVKTAANN